MTVSTWSGTYNTQVTLGLDRPPKPEYPPLSNPTITPKPAVTYQEYDPPVTGTRLCILQHVSGTDHRTEIEINGGSPEAIREFLTALLAGLPEPLVFTDDVVLAPAVDDPGYILTPIAG